MDSVRHENGYVYFHSYGTGKPVIILTGGPGASYLQLEDLAIRVGRSHQALLVEQRGTGRSQPHPYDTSTVNIRTAHQDIVRILDHLKLSKAALLGHSWGGMLAMSFAALHPDKVSSLYLVDSGPFSANPLFAEIFSANMHARLSPEDVQQRNAVFAAGNKKMTPEIQESIYKWELVPVLYDRSKVDSLMKIINKGPLNPKTGSMLMGSFMRSTKNFTDKLPKLTHPVYVIAGAQDPGAFMSYEIKQFIPQAQLFWINESGHFPMYEQPERFYTVLSGILPK